MRAYRSVCTERASCCGAFRSWTFPSLFTHSSQPPMCPPMFVVFGGGCVLILSVFGRGLLVGFRRFRRRCQGGGSIGHSPNSRSRLACEVPRGKCWVARTSSKFVTWSTSTTLLPAAEPALRCPSLSLPDCHLHPHVYAMQKRNSMCLILEV